MAELYRWNGISPDREYERVGYTEDDVRRLATWAAKHVPANLLAPFRALLDGGKTNG